MGPLHGQNPARFKGHSNFPVEVSGVDSDLRVVGVPGVEGVHLVPQSHELVKGFRLQDVDEERSGIRVG